VVLNVGLSAPLALLLLGALLWLAGPARQRHSRVWHFAGAACFIWLCRYRIGEPWVFHHDFNGALFTLFARNHLHHGFLLTGGRDLLNGGVSWPEVPLFYLHHPPLISWFLTLPGAVFGVHEAIMRLATALLVAGGLFFLLRQMESRYGMCTGPLPWLAACAMPALSYYARMPGHEPLTIALLFFLLGFVLRPSPWGIGVACVLLVLASWVGLVYAGLFALLTLLRGRRQHATAAWWGAGIGACTLFCFLGWAHEWQVEPLLNQFRLRASTSAVGGTSFTLSSWVVRLGFNVWELAGGPVLLFGGVGVLIMARRHRYMVPELVWLLLAPVIAVSILTNWAYFHEYWACYLAVPMLWAAVPASTALSTPRDRAGKGLLVALVGGTAAHFAIDELEARYRQVDGYVHEWRLGRAVARELGAEEKYFTAGSVPGPVMLYYADRDFLLWPQEQIRRNAAVRAFVQPRGNTPDIPELKSFLAPFHRSASHRRVYVRRKEAAEASQAPSP